MKNEIKIPLIYLSVALFWMIFSNKILMQLIHDKVLFSKLDLLLDIIFIIGSAFMLFIQIRHQLRSVQKEKEVWQEREEQLRFLINTMPEFVCYKDAEGRWVEANTFALELFQLEGVDYRGKKDSDLAHYTPFYREALMGCAQTDQLALSVESPTRVEERIPRPDGSLLTFDAIKIPLFHEDGSRKGLVVIGRNITERKDAELRLEDSQQRYKSLFEENPDAIFSLDVNGNFRSANAMCEKLVGYTQSELRNMNYTNIVAEEDIPLGVEKFKETLKRESPTYEMTIRHKDGHLVDIKVTNVPIVVKNDIIGTFGIAVDMTEWKLAEEMLRKSDRLSLVGQLAAGVAHEIRNPLASLSGFVQLLKEARTTDNHFYYDIMLSELNRINFIVSEFLFLAKPQIFNFKPLGLKQILDHVITIAQTQAIMNNIEIVLDNTDHLCVVNGDENQLKQVFINILKNAIESMPNGGAIRIEVEEDQQEQVIIRFIDQGIGIPPERLAKLGEPFYSTKEKGMGLGLMVSHKIMEAHKGKIQVTSELGRGTTVAVMLPMVKAGS